MRKKAKIGILLSYIILISLAVWSLTFFIHILNTSSRHITASKDAYVYENQPNQNFGEEDYLYVGNFNSGRTEIYYHFDISSLPSGWTEAKIKVFFDYASSTVDVGVNLTYASWDETIITWNNKPSALKYRGHILNDGIDFNIPLKLENFTNGEVTICLYGKGGSSDGFIQGTSKEGNSDEVPQLRLIYDEIGQFFTPTIVICILTTLFLVVMSVVLLDLAIQKKRGAKTSWRYQPIQHQLRPFQHGLFQQARTSVQKERKINEYITLKLENGRTHIYVNNRRFIQCIRLILNIQSTDVHLYDEIESIDEAVKVYNTNEFPRGLNFIDQRQGLSPEQEFWGHCSNLQAWIEHEYDTRVLMSNVSFPLLRELTEAGDPLAKKVFREEIAQRLEGGYPSVVQYLINQGYIKYFSNSEFKTIIETTNLLINLSSQPKMLRNFLVTCIHRFPILLGDILLKILSLPEGKKILIKSFSKKLTKPDYRVISFGLNPLFIHQIRKALINISNRVGEDTREEILECLQIIDAIIESRNKIPQTMEDSNLRQRFIRLREARNFGIIDDALIQEMFQAERRILDRHKKTQSKCSYCWRVLRKGQITCDWCGHRKDDDDFLPFPYIFKPPGGGDGGGFEEGALVIPVKA